MSNYPDNFTGFHGFQPRSQGAYRERPYAAMSDDLMRFCRANLERAQGLTGCISLRDRVRMIGQIDAEIARRVAADVAAYEAAFTGKE